MKIGRWDWKKLKCRESEIHPTVQSCFISVLIIRSDHKEEKSALS